MQINISVVDYAISDGPGGSTAFRQHFAVILKIQTATEAVYGMHGVGNTASSRFFPGTL